MKPTAAGLRASAARFVLDVLPAAKPRLLAAILLG